MATYGDILVLGLGSSGAAAARYCAGLVGSEATSVTAVDSGDGETLRERADELAMLGVRSLLGVTEGSGRFDLCIASPGIAPHAPIMQWAMSASDRVVSEIEFAWERSDVPWIAVTGTNGKTTTTALVAHLLNSGGIPAIAIGNIGSPAIEAVSQGGVEVFVAEVSSFQLALTERFHPRVAVLLNVTPDHVDWHGSLERYAADKTKVFDNLGEDDTAVVDVDDEGSSPYAEKVAATGATVVRVSRDRVMAGGANAASGVLTLETHGGPVRLVAASELRIVGPHNVSNALAAAAAAHAVGVPASDLRRGLSTFEPIEHRLEPVGRACGAEWYNDSKATNPDAVMKALGAFAARPLVLLAGGRNKGNTFDELAAAAAPVVRVAVTFGEAGPDIADAFERAGIVVERVARMAQAVETAARLAEEGDAVVLSPACASFDEFTGYEHRGRVFKELFHEVECGGGTW